MHDPMTVAFTIKNWLLPAKELSRGHKYRPALVTIWHLDPEHGGDEDSCDWFGNKRKLNKREQALSDAIGELSHVLGNEPFYPHPRLYGAIPTDYSGDTPIAGLRRARREWGRRRFRLHPRWHVWHWKIRIHPVQHFKRWAFSRCHECGARFGWGYAPVSGNWYGRGPGWFRNAEHVYHAECHNELVRRAEDAAAVRQAAEILGI